MPSPCPRPTRHLRASCDRDQYNLLGHSGRELDGDGDGGRQAPRCARSGQEFPHRISRLWKSDGFWNRLSDAKSPSADYLIVIENGSLTLSSTADISVVRTAIIFTGNNTKASAINFPNGTGHTATLAISPPTNSDNPWKGIAIYQNPALTYKVANDWGPGAVLRVDGVIYLPNSDVELQGNAASNADQCTKLVTKTFTTKGSVSMNFSQVTADCRIIGMQQWSDTPIHLVN